MAKKNNDIPDVYPPDDPNDGSRATPLRRVGGRGKVKLSPLTALALACIAVVVAMGLTGRLGVVDLSPEEVAVKVNYVSGNTETIVAPGYKFYLPFVEDVFVLDKRVQNFEMSGDVFRDDNRVPELTVRANDGSNFRFNSIEVQYQVEPSQAARVLADSGPGDSYKYEWIKVHARSILRDEFGRYTAEEIADPGKLQLAFAACEERLNNALAPYGLRIVDIPQQKPIFDQAYESSIEDRKVADQDVERLIAMEEQLRQERDQRFAMVEREKSIEMASLRGELDRDRLTAERDSTRMRSAADAFKIERNADGQSQLAELVARSRGLVDKYTKEAEGVRAQALALASRGEVVVREALIERLAGVRFTFVPYSKDPAPDRLEHVDARVGSSGAVSGGQDQ
jgi:regulator of protease activity HflC (stomatin/prohibitin superfamily)